MRRNYVSIGPVKIRVSSKFLAPWGFPRLRIYGLSVWTWSNSGQLCLAGYHPKSSITWLWAIWIDPRKPWRWRIMTQERMPQNGS